MNCSYYKHKERLYVNLNISSLTYPDIPVTRRGPNYEAAASSGIRRGPNYEAAASGIDNIQFFKIY